MTARVLGSKGTLGALLMERLSLDGLDLRGALTGEQEAQLAKADALVNATGPRVRPELKWDDYFREHRDLASAVARAMKKGAHLVQLSSTSVFGARGLLLNRHDAEAPLQFPSAAYASAKLAAEQAVRAICRERGVRLTVLRLSMVYGPNVDSAVHSALKLARRGVALDLRPRRVRQHLLHVDLLAAAVLRALEKPPPDDAPYLLADPFVLTNEDLFRAAKAVNRRAIPAPVPVSLAASLQRRWPGFPAREPPMTLSSLAVLALDNEFDCGETFAALQLDVAAHARERSFDPYVASFS